uniref:Uncharacterized protein n=1 Tax=Geospiza parvula TaxID=87175 RepID=A0A8U8B923_GEOPR
MRRDAFHCPRLFHIPSNLALSTSRDGAATTSLGNLSQGLTHSPALHSPAQHSPAQHILALHSPAQHSLAQHSPAQHSLALHSSVQHSLALHSSVQHSLALHSIGGKRCILMQHPCAHPLPCALEALWPHSAHSSRQRLGWLGAPACSHT